MRAHVILSLVIIALIVVTSLNVIMELVNFISNSTIEVSPTISAIAGMAIPIELPEIKKYDRIYLVVDGRVNIDDINVSPANALQLPLKVETFEHDVFPTLINEKRYMFIACEDSKKVSIQLHLQPLTPYIIKSIEGHQKYRILSNCSERLICVSLSPIRVHVNNYIQIAFIHPYMQIAEPNLRIVGLVKLIQGRVDYINIVVMTEKNWYAYRVVDPSTPPGTTVSFEIDAYTSDLNGRRGEFLGENLVAVAINIGISRALYEKYSSPVVGIGELVIWNDGAIYRIEPVVRSMYTFNPKIYVLRKFQPSNNYLVSIISLSVLLISLALLTARVARGGLY